MPDSTVNTHWQRVITLAGQAADSCIRGASTRDAALINQSNAVLDEMTTELGKTNEALDDITP